MRASSDPMLTIADSVTDSLSQCGYAFVEDDKVEAPGRHPEILLEDGRDPGRSRRGCTSFGFPRSPHRVTAGRDATPTKPGTRASTRWSTAIRRRG